MAAFAFPNLTDAILTTEIRRLLNEPTARFYSDAEIVYWIDRGAQLISQMTLGHEDTSVTYQITTAAYKFSYNTLGLDTELCMKVEAIIYLASSSATACGSGFYALQKIHPRMINQVIGSTAGSPIYWSDFGESIWIWPPPSATVYGATPYMRLFIYKALANTPTNLRNHLQEYVIFYALSQALEKAGKFEQAQQYMSIFINFIMFHRQDVLYKPADSNDMMTTPDRTQFV